MFLVAQAVPLVLLLILNFSYYAFSFIPYLLPWFVVGTGLAMAAGNGIHAPAVDQPSRWALSLSPLTEPPSGGLGWEFIQDSNRLGWVLGLKNCLPRYQKVLRQR